MQTTPITSLLNNANTICNSWSVELECNKLETEEAKEKKRKQKERQSRAKDTSKLRTASVSPSCPSQLSEIGNGAAVLIVGCE